MNHLREIEGRKIKVEKEYLRLQHRLGNFPMIHLNTMLDICQDNISGDFILTLNSFLAKIDHEYGYVETPLTWWDHFKEDKFPEWLKKKLPVKYQKHKVLYRKMCPHITDKWSDNSYCHLYWIEKKPSEKADCFKRSNLN